MQLLQCSASMPRGSGQCNSCNAVPQCLGVVGSATPAMHFNIAGGQWEVELLQCTASLPLGNGLCKSCHALPRCWGAMGIGTPGMQYLIAWGVGGSATLAINCHVAWGQWAVQLPQGSASLADGIGQCNAWNAFPGCQGVVGSATPAMHCCST